MGSLLGALLQGRKEQTAGGPDGLVLRVGFWPGVPGAVPQHLGQLG